MLRLQVEFTDVRFFLKLWQAKGNKISEFNVQALYVLISYLRWQGEKDVLSVMTTELSATSQGANKTFPWKFSILPKRKDSWMAKRSVKNFSPPPPPPSCKILSKWVSVLRRPPATLQLNSYSTFFKILSQWLLYKEQHSMKYLHLKDRLSYVYKQLRKSLKQDVQNAFNSALLYGWKFRYSRRWTAGNYAV